MTPEREGAGSSTRYDDITKSQHSEILSLQSFLQNIHGECHYTEERREGGGGEMRNLWL